MKSLLSLWIMVLPQFLSNMTSGQQFGLGGVGRNGLRQNLLNNDMIETLTRDRNHRHRRAKLRKSRSQHSYPTPIFQDSYTTSFSDSFSSRRRVQRQTNKFLEHFVDLYSGDHVSNKTHKKSKRNQSDDQTRLTQQEKNSIQRWRSRQISQSMDIVNKIYNESNKKIQYLQFYLTQQILEMHLNGTFSFASKLTKESMFSLNYDGGVASGSFRLENTYSCDHLCMSNDGTLYVDEREQEILRGNKDCWFNLHKEVTSVTTPATLTSAHHGNTSHNLFIMVVDGVPRGSWEELDNGNHMKSWLVQTVNLSQMATFLEEDDIKILSSPRFRLPVHCQLFKDSRRATKKKHERKIKSANQEKACLERRRREEGTKNETCTQKERDDKFGKNWPWNTRNCDELEKRQRKQCKRVKRRRCVAKQMKKKKDLSEGKAKKRCRKIKRRSSKLKKCIRHLMRKGEEKKQAKRMCAKRTKKGRKNLL